MQLEKTLKSILSLRNRSRTKPLNLIMLVVDRDNDLMLENIEEVLELVGKDGFELSFHGLAK